MDSLMLFTVSFILLKVDICCFYGVCIFFIWFNYSFCISSMPKWSDNVFLFICVLCATIRIILCWQYILSPFNFSLTNCLLLISLSALPFSLYHNFHRFILSRTYPGTLHISPVANLFYTFSFSHMNKIITPGDFENSLTSWSVQPLIWDFLLTGRIKVLFKSLLILLKF